MAAQRVVFDSDAFIRHSRSGITRYFTELIQAYNSDADLGVIPVTPYKFVANHHLSHAFSKEFVTVPLPRRLRPPILHALNQRRMNYAPADVVHHSLYEPDGFDRWPARRHVCTVYDFTHEKFPELFPDAAAGLFAKNSYLKRCDALIAISETTARDLREWHPDIDSPVAVAPLGVGPEFAKGSQARVKGLPAHYVLHVGARHVHKNTDLLFRSFAKVSRYLPDVYLVLSGAGLPDESRRLQELGIERRTLRVRLRDQDLPKAYASASAFVFPSLYEGFGLPVVEAMASGCPVIVSDAPALIEVTDGATMVVDRFDSEMLADALLRVLRDTRLQANAARAGRLKAQDYSWQRTAALTAKAYRLAVTR